MRQVSCWLTAGVLFLPHATSAQAPSVVLSPPDLRTYVREVLEKNTGLRAAGSRLSAATERIAPAGALPDPMVTTGLIAVPAPSFDFTAERMTRVPIVIRQYRSRSGSANGRTGARR